MKLELQKSSEGKWDILHEGRRIGYILGGNRRYTAFINGNQTHVHASKKRVLQAVNDYIQMRTDNHKKGIETL